LDAVYPPPPSNNLPALPSFPPVSPACHQAPGPSLVKLLNFPPTVLSQVMTFAYPSVPSSPGGPMHSLFPGLPLKDGMIAFSLMGCTPSPSLVLPTVVARVFRFVSYSFYAGRPLRVFPRVSWPCLMVESFFFVVGFSPHPSPSQGDPAMCASQSSLGN